MNIAALVIAVLFAGCASIPPPGQRAIRDPDNETCRQGRGAEAVAACERIIARPAPFPWPGQVGRFGSSMTYFERASLAYAVSQHYAREGDHARACLALDRARVLSGKVKPDAIFEARPKHEQLAALIERDRKGCPAA